MLSDPEFKALLQYADRPWAGYRKVRKGVKKRLRRHMRNLHCTAIEDYLAKVGQDAAVRAVFEQCLTVTISRFFRDRLLWDYLQTCLLPELAGCFQEGLGCWSAGCANGEEPYSLSMVWEAVRITVPLAPPLRILATDADENCLQRAKNGIYPHSSLKEVPESTRRRWFTRVKGKQQWKMDARLSKRICFGGHQLLDAPPPGPFHLIFLRNNLLTYYQGKLRQDAFQGIAERLIPGGALIIGSHEQLPSRRPPLRRDAACPWVYRMPAPPQ